MSSNNCDCELSHNGIGRMGRECDCPAGNAAQQPQPDPAREANNCMWCRYGDSPYGPHCPIHDPHEAALWHEQRLDTLRAENARLREALEAGVAALSLHVEPIAHPQSRAAAVIRKARTALASTSRTQPAAEGAQTKLGDFVFDEHGNVEGRRMQ